MHWLRGSVGCTNRPATSLRQPSSTPFHGMMHTFAPSRPAVADTCRRSAAPKSNTVGGARGRPRARAALGPPSPAEGRRADTRPIAGSTVALQRHDRSPARAAGAVVVGAVDPVEDPPPRREARDLADLLTDERVLRQLGEDEPEHRLLDELVGDRHRRTVTLGRQAQLVRPEVAHRDAVRLVRQPVGEEEVRREIAHRASLPRASVGAGRRLSATVGWHRHIGQRPDEVALPSSGDHDDVERERSIVGRTWPRTRPPARSSAARECTGDRPRGYRWSGSA